MFLIYIIDKYVSAGYCKTTDGDTVILTPGSQFLSSGVQLQDTCSRRTMMMWCDDGVNHDIYDDDNDDDVIV